MITAVLLGAGVGAGICLIVAGLVPRRRSLAAELARLTAAPTPRAAANLPTVDPQAGWAARVGAPAGRLLARVGLPAASVHRDLMVLGKPVVTHLGEQAALGIGGLVFPPVFAAVLAATGSGIGVVTTVWMSLLVAVVAAVSADLQVKTAAARRRRDLRHALSAFLDLVTIALAGGAGVDQALTDATEVGHGWAYEQIRGALERARLLRQPPWAVLAELGSDYGVNEFSELAATVGLAGTEGAKIRASLVSRAAGMRAHQLADTEAAAGRATERLSLPVVVLFGGFLMFLLYPAITAVLTGL